MRARPRLILGVTNVSPRRGLSWLNRMRLQAVQAAQNLEAGLKRSAAALAIQLLAASQAARSAGPWKSSRASNLSTGKAWIWVVVAPVRRPQRRLSWRRAECFLISYSQVKSSIE